MSMIEEQQQHSTDAVQQKQDELVKIVRKLRWMGMHDEAGKLQNALLQNVPADTVLSGPVETD